MAFFPLFKCGVDGGFVWAGDSDCVIGEEFALNRVFDIAVGQSDGEFRIIVGIDLARIHSF